MKDQKYSRIRDLPKSERKPFAKWLRGQTCPWIEGEPWSEQDAYYQHDYEAWKRGAPVLD